MSIFMFLEKSQKRGNVVTLGPLSKLICVEKLQAITQNSSCMFCYIE